MKMPSVIRLVRHLLLPDWWVLRAFPAAARQAVEAAIARSETRHQGELRLVVEAGLPLASLLSGQSARARAVALFAALGVWDTADNSGVLIYLQLIDRRVEIVADRGIHARVGQAFWDQVCRAMEAELGNDHVADHLAPAAIAAIAAITEMLAHHFPARPGNPNELADAVLIL